MDAVRVYNVCDQQSGKLLKIVDRYGLDSQSLGGYISVVIATHLSMMPKPTTPSELEDLVKQLTRTLDATVAESCARMMAMIKDRRVRYYQAHRREFVPESLEGKNSRAEKNYGKFGDRPVLSEYISAPMSEADMSYALTHMVGFAGSNMCVLRSYKPEPEYFIKPTSTGFKGTEEERAAIIQQRAFMGSNIFVETSRVRDIGDYDEQGHNTISARVDGKHSDHESGCGLATQCLALNTYLRSLDAAKTVCSPFIVDVGYVKHDAASVFAVPGSKQVKGSHHVVAIPVAFNGVKQLVVFDSIYRKNSYKSAGQIYPQEHQLAAAMEYVVPLAGAYMHVPNDDVVQPKAFTQRRCKLCGVIHSTDMHAEFQ